MEAEPAVVVVDDDASMRDSLTLLLEVAKLRPVTYPSAERFLEEYDPSRPGCVLLDVNMPGMSGLDLQDLMAEKGWLSPVILMAGNANVEMAVRGTKAGAFDFIEKPFMAEALLERIRQAIDEDRERRLRYEKRCQRDERLASLTPRERQVADLLVAGKLSKEVAVELQISAKTVEKHRANIMVKIQARSVADLVSMLLASF
jgi:two-component system response regulator FixJ